MVGLANLRLAPNIRLINQPYINYVHAITAYHSRLTIVTKLRNAEQWLDESPTIITIQSLIYTGHMELLVYNDGSMVMTLHVTEDQLSEDSDSPAAP